jgi:hypothetical protein
MACVDEAVFEGSADVMGRQACNRGHHVPGELAQLQRALVLAPPPVVLRSEKEREVGRRTGECEKTFRYRQTHTHGTHATTTSRHINIKIGNNKLYKTVLVLVKS